MEKGLRRPYGEVGGLTRPGIPNLVTQGPWSATQGLKRKGSHSLHPQWWGAPGMAGRNAEGRSKGGGGVWIKT